MGVRMRARVRVTLLIAITLLVAWSVIAKSLPAESREQVREAAVAGGFYPADPKELAATVEGLLAHASVPAQKGDRRGLSGDAILVPDASRTSRAKH